MSRLKLNSAAPAGSVASKRKAAVRSEVMENADQISCVSVFRQHERLRPRLLGFPRPTAIISVKSLPSLHSECECRFPVRQRASGSAASAMLRVNARTLERRQRESNKEEWKIVFRHLGLTLTGMERILTTPILNIRQTFFLLTPQR